MLKISCQVLGDLLDCLQEIIFIMDLYFQLCKLLGIGLLCYPYHESIPPLKAFSI